MPLEMSPKCRTVSKTGRIRGSDQSDPCRDCMNSLGFRSGPWIRPIGSSLKTKGILYFQEARIKSRAPKVYNAGEFLHFWLGSLDPTTRIQQESERFFSYFQKTRMRANTTYYDSSYCYYCYGYCCYYYCCCYYYYFLFV